MFCARPVQIPDICIGVYDKTYKGHKARVLKTYGAFTKTQVDRVCGSMKKRVSALLKSKGKVTALDIGGNTKMLES